MARQRDSELERLAAAQDAAFRRKQEAYGAMQRAWDRRSSARDALNEAYEAKQSAYEELDRAWQRLQNVRDTNGPKIDSLNTQQEAAYQNMRRSFEAASLAYDQRDGASAKAHSLEGHAYKEESQRCVARRRELVYEIRSAKAEHDALRPPFERAKEEFHAAKQAHSRAKTEHERAQAEFKERKAEAEKAKLAFHKRLDYLKAQNKQRREDRRLIAEKAGVPYQYLDSVKVSKDSDGNTNIYFGGVGEPAGPGHGHYVMDRNGNVTYSRDPFDPHGAHNFKSNQADYFDAVRTESVFGGDEFSFHCTYKGLPAYVETGYDDRTGRQKINIYYGTAVGMIGRGHGHAIAYRDTPFTIVEDRPPR